MPAVSRYTSTLCVLGSTVQPPFNSCLFSCLQDPFSIIDERKRKEERKGWEKLTQKTQSILSCAGGSTQLPTLEKMAHSYVRNDKCYSRCYLGICLPQNSEKTWTLLCASAQLKGTYDGVRCSFKRDLPVFLPKPQLLWQPSPWKSLLRTEDAHCYCYHAFVLFLEFVLSPKLTLSSTQNIGWK